MSQRPSLIFGIVLGGLVASLPASAGEANLDPGFGTYGIVDATPANLYAQDLLLQSDGKLVAVGMLGTKIGAVRYQADGSLDTGFGSGGMVQLAFNGRALGGTSQSDGKIVLAGFVQSNVGDTAWALIRLNADGTLDGGFGTGGSVVNTPNSARENLGAVTEIAGGQLLVVGRKGAGQGLVVVRFNADGSIDGTFGNAGIAGASFQAYGLYYALAIQSDGKILANGGGEEIARFNADGSTDTGFGSGGTGTVALEHETLALAVQPDGKIIAGGGFYAEIEISRLNADGSPDTSYGDNGDIDIYGFNNVRRMILQPDGSLVATTGLPVDSDAMGLVRFDANGALDPTFGSGGRVDVRLTQYYSVSPVGLVQQPDGKFVEAAYTTVLPHEGPLGVVVARFGSTTCGNGVVDPGEQCDDGNLNALDCCGNGCGIGGCGRCGTCNAQLECVAALASSCVAADPRGARLAIRDTAGQDLLSWKLRKAPVLTFGQLGDPTYRESYDLCLYDESGPTPVVRYEKRLRATTGWRSKQPKGYDFFGFVDNSLGENGIVTARIRVGLKTTANVTAKGTGVAPPAIPLGVPLRVQLRSDGGACFEATYSNTRHDSGGRLDATSD